MAGSAPLLQKDKLTEEALIHHHLVEDSSIRREEEGYRHQQALENQIEALRRQEEELHEAQHGAQEKLRNLSLQQEILEGEKTKWAEDSRTAQQKLDACRLEKERSSTSFPSSSGPTPSVLSSSPPSTLSSDLSKSSKTTSSPSSSPEEESLISKSLLSKRTKKAFSPNNETTPLLPKGDLSLQDINTWFLIERTNEEQIPCLSKKQTLLAFVIPSEESDSVSYLEEQPIDEETILIQKAQLLFSKIEGTSLEDFGKYYMGHVIDKRYRLKDYGGLIAAGIMAAGTAAATSPIVEWSLYNKYTSKWIGGGALDEVILGHYINITTALIALTDATSFMLAATSPSTRTFTIPKSKREKAVDWILVPPAGIPGIFLLLLGFQVQQEHKKATGTSGWWNEYDQYFYFSSLGFFPYLFAKTFNGMRLAVSKMFHHSIPEHVREQVLALRQLEARVDYLSDHQVHDLYAFLRSPLFNHNTLKLKEWAKYFFKGEMSDVYTVEGLLTYLCITKYAQETMKEESEELQKLGYKNIKSRIIGALGTPAGFAVIAISLYGTFEAFMDPKIALGSSLTGATLGFLPGAILESHNLQESLYTLNKGIVPYLKGGKRYFVNTLKDPYSWAKGAGRVFSFTQNLLTNIFPILFSLAILIPEALKVDETTQEIITGVMLFLAVPLVLSELANGTIDIQGHVMKIAYSVQDIAYCCRKSTSSASREKRIIKGWLQETITTTLQFTPKHIEKLDDLAQHLEGKN
ncbi:hypothetical protein QM565_21455 [Geitlerinema splendidum]|nr:hypothetical protein [Geitlerinema splendidum]